MRIPVAIRLFLIIAVCLPSALFSYGIKGADLTTDAGTPVRAVGFDVPYMLQLDTAAAEAAFVKMKSMGVRAVRINASAHGEFQGSFRPSPAEFSESAFKKLDTVLALADKHGVGVIIVLSDMDSAGVYSVWAGGSNKSVFFRDKISRERFKQFVSKIVSRVNSVNSKIYSKDLSIMAWELCERADYPGENVYEVLYGWAGEMGGYIKKLGARHPVGISLARNDTAAEGINAADVFMMHTLDYVSYHAADADVLSKMNGAFYSSVNKPVVAVVRAADTASAAAAFFKSAGSVIFFEKAGIGSYEADKSFFSLSDPAIAAGINAAIKSGNETKGSVPLASLSSVAVEPGSEKAAVTFTANKGAAVEILAGRKLPLKEIRVSVTASGAASKAVLSGLKPGEKYMMIIKVRDGNLAYVSKIYSFTTSKLQRLQVKPFTRSNNFIKVKGTQFYDGNRVYKYLGTGNYYIRHTDRVIADGILKEAAAVGFKVIRIGSNAEAEGFDAIDANSRDRFLRIGPEFFNEEAYKNIDWVLDRAAKYGLRVILHFTDNWEYYGGIPVYAKWAGVSKNQFYTDEKAKEYFKQTIDAFVKRKNTVNGKLYKDDPTIFAYNLCNEPRNEDDQTGKTLALWCDEMAGYVKSLDKNHMVTTGADSFFNKEDGTHYSGADFVTIHSGKNIDYCNYHIYPTYTHNNFALSTTEWMIKKFIKEAHETLGKPVIMEEYGIGSNLPDYPKAKWIYEMTRIFFENGGNGANYWFFIHPEYAFGDGFEVRPTETEYMNAFIPWTNKNNAGGY